MEQDRNGWVRRGVEEPGATGEAQPRGGSKTFIGDGADFQGVLKIRDDFRIDGEFRGEIVCEGTVVVGEAGGIEASIRAREVVIVGAVVGDVTASRQVILRSTGRLHGDIETPCIQIDKGAVLNGRTTMARPEASLRAGASTEPATGPVATPA